MEVCRRVGSLDAVGHVVEAMQLDPPRAAIVLVTGVGVMLVDIDNFKELNDTHGHAHGDQQLIKCVEMLKTIARRPWDLAARYGGDEFVVFLYDISEEDMQKRTQKLLDQVRSSGKSFTVSIGTAHCVATPTIQIEELLRRADSRLYQSKEQGRDRATTGGS